jgi:hypothetical protein
VITDSRQIGSAETKHVWLSLSAAAAFVDVPYETIIRVSIPWQEDPVAHRIRFSLLLLDAGSKGEPRYFAPDVEHLLAGGGPVDATAVTVDQPAEPRRRNRLRCVERGIYRDVKSLTLFERPFIGGKRICRSLGTTKITEAREELRRRKAARQGGENDTEPEYLNTVGEVIRHYQDADYPDKHLSPRSERTRKEEARHCALLLKYWESVRSKLTSIVSCDNYRDWRLRRIKQGRGLRTIDRELMTLNNAFRFAYRRGQAGRNPLVDRPRYQPSKHVVHCRQCMPGGTALKFARRSSSAPPQ